MAVLNACIRLEKEFAWRIEKYSQITKTPTKYDENYSKYD